MKPVANRWGDKPLFTQGVFLAALVLGSGSIVLLKWLGAPQLWVTLTPIIVMVLYGLLVFFPPVRLRPDQTGDNVYYLGFLYTLTSLAIALYQFSREEGVDQIVNNFGIALATTIVGVAGRILLNQMRVDPFEMERAQRLALIESAANLRKELDSSVIEFTAYRRHVQQAAADGIRELADIATEQLGGATQKLDALVASTTTRINEVVTRWGESAETEVSRSQQVSSAMEGLSLRLGEVKPPADIIDEKLKPAATAVTHLASASDEAASKIGLAAEGLGGAAGQMKEIASVAQQILEVTRAQSQTLAETSELLAAARAQVAQAQAASSSFQSEVSQTTREIGDGLAKFLSGLDTQLAEARRLAEMHRADTSAALESKLAAFKEDLRREKALGGGAAVLVEPGTEPATAT